jgi:hypothetical protein
MSHCLLHHKHAKVLASFFNDTVLPTYTFITTVTDAEVGATKGRENYFDLHALGLHNNESFQ